VTEHEDPDRAQTTELPAQDDGQQAAAPEQQAAGWAPELPSPSPSAPDFARSAAAGAADRPEVMIGAAFAGGLLAALILKRLAR